MEIEEFNLNKCFYEKYRLEQEIQRLSDTIKEHEAKKAEERKETHLKLLNGVIDDAITRLTNRLVQWQGMEQAFVYLGLASKYNEMKKEGKLNELESLCKI